MFPVGSSENGDRKTNSVCDDSSEKATKSKEEEKKRKTRDIVPWDFVTVTSPSVSVPPSCSSSSAGGGGRRREGGGEDEWSRQVDDLDHLMSVSPGHLLDSFSDLPDITEVIADCHSTAIDAGYVTVDEADPKRSPYPPPTEDEAPGAPPGDVDVASDTGGGVTADMHLREVEEQLQNIFTPTPIELTKVTLFKRSDSDDFGFSLSDGVFEKGVYVGAVKPRGPGAEVLRPYDRLLQVGGGL